nr:hypothetical protein [Actinomadura rayongensis]
MAGYATNADAHHIVAPLEDGSRAAACMRAALDDAGVAPDEVAHVNAHGTATLLNDRSEAAAIRRCFNGAGPPVTAPKGVVGHMIGAAGAFEAVVMATSVRTGRVPPVANHRAQPDGDAEITVVRDRPADVGPGPAISNSFGFGGHNASLVMVPA